jgi:O-6-methylguanine DNA methyltransferase
MQQDDTFFDRVWSVVAQIPAGRVTTYGHIARHLASARSARAVGWALKAAAHTGLPCHRVVNRRGDLTGARHFETPTVMRERLEGEGVAFRPDGSVDLEAHVWDPARQA